jgi:hypothetical protein
MTDTTPIDDPPSNQKEFLFLFFVFLGFLVFLKDLHYFYVHAFFDASLKLRMGNGSKVRACFVFLGNMFVKMPK